MGNRANRSRAVHYLMGQRGKLTDDNCGDATRTDETLRENPIEADKRRENPRKVEI